jgi:hypothetical protein
MLPLSLDFPFLITPVVLHKTRGAIKNGQSRDNGNIGHTRDRTNTKPQGQSRMDNQETMATLGTQDTGPTPNVAIVS